MNALQTYRTLTDSIESKELGTGAVTVEYVVIVMVVVGLGAALIAFRDNIKDFLNNAGTQLETMLGNLGNTAGA